MVYSRMLGSIRLMVSRKFDVGLMDQGAVVVDGLIDNCVIDGTRS